MAPKNKSGKGSKESKDAGGGGDRGGGGGGGSSSAGKLKPATSINVRHILCEKHAKKELALQKLRDGVKFDEVAREFSEDKARQGGSLGWKIRGSLIQDFEKVAFDLQPSTTASPVYGEVKTGEGYHIVMVEGRK